MRSREPRLLALALADLRRAASERRCVACGAADAEPSGLLVAVDADLRDLDDYPPPPPLCPACATQQRRASRRHLCGVLLAGPGIQLVALAAVVLLPLASPAAAIFATLLAAVLGLALLRPVRRRAGEAMPALLLRGAGQVVELRAAPDRPAPEEVGSGPYRRSHQVLAHAPPAAAAAVEGGRSVIAASLVGGALGMAFLYPQVYPVVVLDNWARRPFVVSVDGSAPRRIEGGDDLTLRLRHGHHSLAVRGLGSEETETLSVELPWGRNHLLSVPGERCYAVSERSLVRGSAYAGYRASLLRTWTVEGRWIAAQDPGRAAAGSCDDPAPGALLWR
jgi:hypothetical protein